MAYIHACKFQRTEKDNWEYGFYINEEIIIDRYGKIVKEVNNIINCCHEGCFILTKNKKVGKNK